MDRVRKSLLVSAVGLIVLVGALVIKNQPAPRALVWAGTIYPVITGLITLLFARYERMRAMAFVVLAGGAVMMICAATRMQGEWQYSTLAVEIVVMSIVTWAIPTQVVVPRWSENLPDSLDHCF